MSKSKNDDEETTVTLTLENDEVLECSIISIFDASGKTYIALLPISDDEKYPDNEVFLYRFHEENGEPILENIEDDDEYDAAVDGFDEWMDTQEFEDLMSEEDDFDDDENN